MERLRESLAEGSCCDGRCTRVRRSEDPTEASDGSASLWVLFEVYARWRKKWWDTAAERLHSKERWAASNLAFMSAKDGSSRFKLVVSYTDSFEGIVSSMCFHLIGNTVIRGLQTWKEADLPVWRGRCHTSILLFVLMLKMGSTSEFGLRFTPTKIFLWHINEFR